MSEPDKKSKQARSKKDMPTIANGSESKFKNTFAGPQNAADHLCKSDATPSMASGDVAAEAAPPYIYIYIYITTMCIIE